MKSSSSCGIGGLTIKLIKLSCLSIVPVLVYIINLSIEHNIFPEAWKIALVTPLFEGEMQPRKKTIALYPYCLVLKNCGEGDTYSVI